MSICLRRRVSENDTVTFEYAAGEEDVEELTGTITEVHDGRGDTPNAIVVDCDEASNFYVSIAKMIVRRQRHTNDPRRLLSLMQD